MGYVVVQIVAFLLIAGGLGFVAGWMLRGWGLDGSTRMGDGYEREQRAALLRELHAARAERDQARTQMLEMRAGSADDSAAGSMAVSEVDDLKRIKGIGPKLEQKLIAMGITRFAQIASWSEADANKVNAALSFSGRIERDRWIEQARRFAAGSD